jgi:hypothetical protein
MFLMAYPVDRGAGWRSGKLKMVSYQNPAGIGGEKLPYYVGC